MMQLLLYVYVKFVFVGYFHHCVPVRFCLGYSEYSMHLIDIRDGVALQPHHSLVTLGYLVAPPTHNQHTKWV